ncbi:hypothetical protein AK812_SmicGene19616 [Symbiodinium microadriaticum]|uniref:Uncharacterized protein n=1 Tax=Symbiodinium microadriaticum TaxID=2951 RepID=A0A1Q9DS36_SYMMI|nr:hypothetical protein AK812_SmicGene19616 [Symbiodinium microadriaticum]
MTARGGNKQPPILLGGGAAAAIPVPMGDVELEGEGDVLSPGGRKRGGGAPDPAGPPKKEKTALETVTLDVAKVRDLLVEQSKELLAAQQGQLSQVTQLETALQELAGAVKNNHSGGGRLPGSGVADDRRRSTLVIGGWPRDSRRQDILRELKEAVQKLGLSDLVDQEAFCTGPRRSIALMPMSSRESESEADKRARMFKFVSAFASNELYSGAGTKLWCSFSKSPEERAIAAHAALVKRVVVSFDPILAQEQLDFEYKTGTAWGPDGMLCSSSLPVPPKHDHKGIDVSGEPPFKRWIDVGLLARLVGKSVKQAGAMLSVGSVHLTPGATHAQSKQEMAEFMGSSPKGAVPAVCQCDANASIRWRVLDGEVMPVGVDGKANEVVSQLVNARFQLVSPGEGQWGRQREWAITYVLQELYVKKENQVPPELPILQSNLKKGSEPAPDQVPGVLREFTRPTSVLVAFLAMLVGDADRQNASAESRAVTSTARELLKNLVMRAALTSEFRVVVVNLGDGSATNVPVAGNGAIPGGSIWQDDAHVDFVTTAASSPNVAELICFALYPEFQDSSQDFQLLRCVAVGMLAQLAKFLAASLDLVKVLLLPQAFQKFQESATFKVNPAEYAHRAAYIKRLQEAFKAKHGAMTTLVTETDPSADAYFAEQGRREVAANQESEVAWQQIHAALGSDLLQEVKELCHQPIMDHVSWGNHVSRSQHPSPCMFRDVTDLVPLLKSPRLSTASFVQKKHEAFSSVMQTELPCCTHRETCAIPPVDIDVSGLPCTDQSRMKRGREFFEGSTSPVFIAWAIRLKRQGIKLAVLENTPDIPQEQLDSLLGDMYDIRKLDVDLSHCGHGGASRRRVYFLLTLKDAFEVLAEPSDLYQMVVDIVKSVGQTRVRDYFHAGPVELMCEAEHVARQRGKVVVPGHFDFSYLLNEREKLVIRELDAKFWQTQGRDPSLDPDLVYCLADNPQFTCLWSATSGRLPCLRRNAGSAKFWSPLRKRWLTGYAPCLFPCDIAWQQLVGNCMAFSNVALVLMVFLSSFRPLIGADESCNAQPSNDGGGMQRESYYKLFCFSLPEFQPLI